MIGIYTYYRHLSADIKTTFLSPKGRMFELTKLENCLLYDAIHDFSVLLRTGSNPADINLVSKPYYIKYISLKEN